MRNWVLGWFGKAFDTGVMVNGPATLIGAAFVVLVYLIETMSAGENDAGSTGRSNVISTPKIFLPDQAKPVITAASPGLSMPEPAASPDPATAAFVYDLERDMLRDLRRSRRRERFLIALFAAEVLFLISGFFLHH